MVLVWNIKMLWLSGDKDREWLVRVIVIWSH